MHACKIYADRCVREKKRWGTHNVPNELGVHPLPGCAVSHLLRDDTLLGVVHLSEYFVPGLLASLDPFSSHARQTLLRIRSEGASGVVHIEVRAPGVRIRKVDSAERHPHLVASLGVDDFLVLLGRIRVGVSERSHLVEIRVVRVNGALHLPGARGVEPRGNLNLLDLRRRRDHSGRSGGAHWPDLAERLSEEANLESLRSATVHGCRHRNLAQGHLVAARSTHHDLWAQIKSNIEQPCCFGFERVPWYRTHRSVFAIEATN